jgi:hypothetical protein
VDFLFDGSEYRWQSEKAGWTDYREGSEVNLRSFVRPNGRRLYKVAVTKVA